jgi:hypothetical protein
MIESRKPSIKLKPILSRREQAASHGSIIARSVEFNRDLRSWRAYIVTQWNRRDPAFSAVMRYEGGIPTKEDPTGRGVGNPTSSYCVPGSALIRRVGVPLALR